MFPVSSRSERVRGGLELTGSQIVSLVLKPKLTLINEKMQDRSASKLESRSSPGPRKNERKCLKTWLSKLLEAKDKSVFRLSLNPGSLFPLFELPSGTQEIQQDPLRLFRPLQRGFDHDSPL
jgi:hypothetical protein